jgi:predicted metal-binding membrane protein
MHSPRRSTVRKVIDRAFVVLCAGAWLLLLTSPLSAMKEMGGHVPADGSRLHVAWLLMLLAMMLPVLGVPLSHLFDRSLARRRLRVVALFMAAYFGIWMMCGLLLSLLPTHATPSLVLVIAGIVTLVWQCSPAKQHCLNRCHALPSLSAFGLQSDCDALAFGLRHGAWCIGSCLPLMISVTLVPGGHLVAMAAAAVWIFAERLERPRRPAWSLGVPVRLWRMARANASSFVMMRSNRFHLYEAKPSSP